jgi:hypothetical protein
MKTGAIILIVFAVFCIPLFICVNMLDHAGKALKHNLNK